MATIVKASGEMAQFDKGKLRRSLPGIGADPALVDEIIEEVKYTMQNGMTTHAIFKTRYFGLSLRKILRRASSTSKHESRY